MDRRQTCLSGRDYDIAAAGRGAPRAPEWLQFIHHRSVFRRTSASLLGIELVAVGAIAFHPWLVGRDFGCRNQLPY
jgi:hypothetical protein